MPRASARTTAYRFRIAAMGLAQISAAFVVLAVGAVPLAGALAADGSGARAPGVVIGAVTAVTALVLFVGVVRTAVVVTPAVLVVRNPLRTHRIPWSRVEAVRVEPVSGFGPGSQVVMVVILAGGGEPLRLAATRTVVDGSGFRLFPLLAVLDIPAGQHGFVVEHRLPDGADLPGYPIPE